MRGNEGEKLKIWNKKRKISERGERNAVDNWKKMIKKKRKKEKEMKKKRKQVRESKNMVQQINYLKKVLEAEKKENKASKNNK